MIVIIDYGMGNLKSVQKAIEKIGYKAIIIENPLDLSTAKGAILPGVGAFKDCYEGLKHKGFIKPIRDFVSSGKPLLGICVGLQLLFEYGEEGSSEGLGIFKGKVVRFPPYEATGLKVPHMGWNYVLPVDSKNNPLIPNNEGGYAYFVHSYYPQTFDEEIILATSEYGIKFPCIVGRKNVFGVQFHPEKSQHFGLEILRNFCKLIEEQE
ncbi:MAG: imidazole glycerol phosphate synthase subunit HisH [Candidatus Hydrogenedentes bacterium]|nr:imidazole glycerol phosphate synthase subunit HisH [Candidatus Hydrogenedentota bacterium]